MTSPLRVTVLGSAARRALAADHPWWVLAVFRRSFYCRDQVGSLICLGPPSLGGGPLNAIVDLSETVAWPVTAPRPGARMHRDGSLLWLDGRIVLSLAHAAAWEPPPPPERWDDGTLARGLATLAEESRTRPAARELGELIPQLTTRWSSANGRSAIDGGLVSRAAWRGAVALTEWVGTGLRAADEDLPPPPREAASLIGLGPGLTPSGDDFLVGVLVALHAVGQPEVAERLASWALPVARAHTSAISVAHLRCAALGEGSAPLHDALAKLGSPHGPDLGACLAAIDAIGHSSGWDGLAGVAAVCGAYLRAGSGTRRPPSGRAP